MDKKTETLILNLFEKYRLSGQDTNDYLEGLLVSNYEPYWKYLHLDTLLSLQNPKTDFRDEFIFITYHQITELYFRLILHEFEGLSTANPEPDRFIEVVKRTNRYFNNLIHSFDIMTDGMNPDDFLKFRMALLPASGFQSFQFRLIEIHLTGLEHLCAAENRIETLNGQSVETKYNNIYWKKGSIDSKTGEKTLTLRQFEKQYDEKLKSAATELVDTNLYALYKALKDQGKSTSELQKELKELDTSININWRLAHYKSAVRYLHRSGEDIQATGGTNWQKFLPPRFQKVISFPDLWSEQEKTNWGKSWVTEIVNA